MIEYDEETKRKKISLFCQQNAKRAITRHKIASFSFS